MDQGPKWRAILLLALCEVLVLALWFSATAVIPALKARHGLSDGEASLYTSAVSLGFVVGTLISAVFGLADRLPPKRFFLASALAAAAANGAILLLTPGSALVVLCRFLTGACMAGVYPVGMKMAATWAKGDMGLLIGLLVGALTLGSAAPHLFNAAGGIDWRFTLAAGSLCALAAALLINLVTLGPGVAKAPPFRPALALEAWRNRPLRLANLGYFGHMWELYAMWGWIGLFLQASFRESLGAESRIGVWASLATFAVIAAGALGCLLGGLFADRWGRTTLTMAAMGASGICALFAGLLFGGDPLLLSALCIFWGAAVVADSPQFSSCVIELSDPQLRGTMVTVQTSLGFLLTLVTIHLVPYWIELVGWRWGFAILAPGPFLGVLAMGALRAHPAAVKLAGGRR